MSKSGFSVLATPTEDKSSDEPLSSLIRFAHNCGSGWIEVALQPSSERCTHGIHSLVLRVGVHAAIERSGGTVFRGSLSGGVGLQGGSITPTN
jgi:hypothetical protein